MVVMEEHHNSINLKEECFLLLKMRYCASHKTSLLSKIHSTPLYRIFLQDLQSQGHKAHHANITERSDLQQQFRFRLRRKPSQALVNDSDTLWANLALLHYLNFCNTAVISDCLVTVPNVCWLKVTKSSSIFLPYFRVWCLRSLLLLANFEHCGSRPYSSAKTENDESSVRIGNRRIRSWNFII